MSWRDFRVMITYQTDRGTLGGKVVTWHFGLKLLKETDSDKTYQCAGLPVQQRSQ